MVRIRAENHELGELGLHQLSGQLLTDEDFEAEQWYDAQPDWPQYSSNGLQGTLQQWQDIASEALASASRMFEKRVGNTSINMTQGIFGKEKTVGDQIAAYTLAVQESPVHRLDELNTLLTFGQRRRREKRLAMEALKDLFVNNLLPNDRRLISFEHHDFSCERNALSKRHLVYALFESELKAAYLQFVNILEQCGQDNLPVVKKKAVKLIFELLIATPENEKVLLAMLVNKLGDPDRSVSSAAAQNLTRLIGTHHPQMRGVVVQEVEQLLLRPNIKRRAQFYAVSFLNRISLRGEDTQLARTLVKIYMDIFIMCLSETPEEAASKPKKASAKVKLRKKRHREKKANKIEQPKKEISDETLNSRLMAALLLGVNRAFPYTKPDQNDTSYDKYLNPLFRVAHADSFGPATQALALLHQVSQSNSVQNDRLYRALYSRIYDAPESSDKIQASFLNLLLKTVKSDTNPSRVKALSKRLLQSAVHGSSAYAGACVIVLSEFFRQGHQGLLKSFISLPEQDDGDEIFFDTDKLDDTNSAKENEPEMVPDDPSVDEESVLNIEYADAAEYQRSAKSGERSIGSNETTQVNRGYELYDPRKRDPKYAGAERSSLWEVVTLCSHFHPSVSLFAKSICKDLKAAQTTGDPLKDFSTIAFLDRFSYKKVKNRIGKSLYGRRSSHYRDNPVANSIEFQRLVDVGNVEADDDFLVKFFETNPERVKKEKLDDGVNKDSDIDSEEEAYEQAIEKELRRLGADTRTLSKSSAAHGPHIDEEDEDELKAFEKAFANEMVGSEDEGEDVKDRENLSIGAEATETISDEFDIDVSNDEPESERNRNRNPENTKHVSSMSVFAPAEEYEETINKELRASKVNGNIIDQQSREKKGSRKRQEIRQTPKSRKKHRVT